MSRFFKSETYYAIRVVGTIMVSTWVLLACSMTGGALLRELRLALGG